MEDFERDAAICTGVEQAVKIRHEMEQSNCFLDVIAKELGSINKRVARYLDRVEEGMASSLKADMPTRLGAVRYCSWCMDELDRSCSDYATVCDHASLCAACAPCDECSEPTDD
jgi:hypothetical protein